MTSETATTARETAAKTTAAKAAHQTGPSRHHSRGRHAAHRAHQRNTLRVEVPVLGVLTLPPPDQLAYLGGITALVALGIVEWPVGVLLGAGHMLAADRNHKILADFGEALEEA